MKSVNEMKILVLYGNWMPSSKTLVYSKLKGFIQCLKGHPSSVTTLECTRVG